MPAVVDGAGVYRDQIPVPQLVAVVKGYADYEKQLFERIAERHRQSLDVLAGIVVGTFHHQHALAFKRCHGNDVSWTDLGAGAASDTGLVIDPGQPVGIDIDALPGEPIVAAVSRVSPVVDPQTGTFKITVEIVDKERRIKPGMFGRIGVVQDVHENALQIPRSAIVDLLAPLEVAGESDVISEYATIHSSHPP